MLAIEDTEKESRARKIDLNGLINMYLEKVRRLKTRLHNAEARSQFLSATVHTLDVVNFDVETEIQVLEAMLEEITDEKQALEATVDELGRKYHDVETEKKALKQEVQELKDDKASLTDKLSKSMIKDKWLLDAAIIERLRAQQEREAGRAKTREALDTSDVTIPEKLKMAEAGLSKLKTKDQNEVLILNIELDQCKADLEEARKSEVALAAEFEVVQEELEEKYWQAVQNVYDLNRGAPN